MVRVVGLSRIEEVDGGSDAEREWGTVGDQRQWGRKLMREGRGIAA